MTNVQRLNGYNALANWSFTQADFVCHVTVWSRSDDNGDDDYNDKWQSFHCRSLLTNIIRTQSGGRMLTRSSTSLIVHIYISFCISLGNGRRKGAYTISFTIRNVFCIQSTNSLSARSTRSFVRRRSVLFVSVSDLLPAFYSLFDQSQDMHIVAYGDKRERERERRETARQACRSGCRRCAGLPRMHHCSAASSFSASLLAEYVWR